MLPWHILHASLPTERVAAKILGDTNKKAIAPIRVVFRLAGIP
jgi:hypothetical protein